MSIIEIEPESLKVDEAPGFENYLNCSHGFWSWAATRDHKRIGMMYLVSVLTSFLLGGLLALLIRMELWTPERTIMDHDTYNHTFTLHGAVMTFLFIIPSIPAALGNFILPVMLGAKDVAFPKLNLASYYLWVGGAVFLLAAIVLGGLDTGWTFYTPYSTTTTSSVITASVGVFILGFSSIFTGLNFIVTMHTMRPQWMTWFKMPLFLWSLYATSIIQVLATPVLGITLTLLIAERALGIGIFDPKLGGDPVLFQHFFWFYSHPAVYIMILPAMGIISEIISVFLGFLVWGHHMFTSGQSRISAIVFSALTFSVSIPSGIKVFNWLATMYRGSIILTTPMCFALSFIFLFTIGGLSGLFLGALATDIHLHDTYFVVAHFHYVMMGGTLVSFIAGLFYWWPKMTGRMYSELWGRIGCFGVFAAFNLTFFPQFILGARGMPRRYYNYDPKFQLYHQLSTIGAFLLGISLCVVALTLIYSLYRGRKAPANPWGAASVEWQTSSPPPLHNFETDSVPGDPYDLDSQIYDPDLNGYRRRVSSEELPPRQSALTN